MARASAELAVAAADVHPGFQLQFDNSRFEPQGRGAASTVRAGAVSRTRTAHGVFVRKDNGAIKALPDADAPGLALAPFGETDDEHNAAVREYFVAAGMPADQVGDVLVRHMVGRDREEGGGPDSGQRLIARYSSIVRVIDGIPVDDSIAWARINSAGDAVSETVYWPDIPRPVVAQAVALQRMLSNASEAASFRARLPERARGAGRVAIRHSSMHENRPFEAVAVYEAMVTKDGNKPSLQRFDANGAPVRLAREVADEAQAEADEATNVKP